MYIPQKIYKGERNGYLMKVQNLKIGQKVRVFVTETERGLFAEGLVTLDDPQARSLLKENYPTL